MRGCGFGSAWSRASVSRTSLDDDLRRWDCPRTTAHEPTEAARESVVMDWWGGRVCDFCPESLVECSAPLSISRIAGQHPTERAERAVGLLQFLRSGNWVDEPVDRAPVASRPVVFFLRGAREEISRAGLGVGVYGGRDCYDESARVLPLPCLSAGVRRRQRHVGNVARGAAAKVGASRLPGTADRGGRDSCAGRHAGATGRNVHSLHARVAPLAARK